MVTYFKLKKLKLCPSYSAELRVVVRLQFCRSGKYLALIHCHYSWSNLTWIGNACLLPSLDQIVQLENVLHSIEIRETM